MKKILTTLSLLFILPLCAAVSENGNNNGIVTIDLLITTTEISLENQKKLRELIVEYQTLEKQYMDSQDDLEILYKVIKVAKRTLDAIKANHLTHNFDSKFMEELNVFAQVGSKKGIPKP